MGMSDQASPAPYPENEAERADAVRRRALPVAVCGVICAVAGIVLLLMKTIDDAHPPSILGVNLSFCAIMMGVGILFYARGTTGTKAAARTCVLAMVVGLAGTLVFTKQSFDYRMQAEGQELGNVAAIANAARGYATAHGGTYPADLGVMLEEKLITPETLHSPNAGTALAERTTMGPEDKTRGDFLKYVEAHSDYQYFGGNLKLKDGAEEFSKIVVASGYEPIKRTNLVVGFADGRADFVDLEEAENVVKAANAARAKLGFAAMLPPESVTKAEEFEKTN
jgi:hypothetical protein